MVRRKNKKKQNELVFAYKVNLDYREQIEKPKNRYIMMTLFTHLQLRYLKQIQ